MESTFVPWLLCAVAVVAAGISTLRLRALLGDLERARSATEELERKLASRAERAGKASESEARLRTDLQTAQRKLDKAKKRTARAHDDRQGEAGRIHSLECEIRERNASLEAAREEIARLEHRPPRVVEPARAGPDLAVLEARAQQDSARVVELEAQLAGVSGQLQRSERDLARMRERIRTQDKLYLAIHGEIELKKDEIRQLTAEGERLRAFKVAVVDPIPAHPTPAHHPDPA
jgi:chromosome segregation ATPase